MITVEEAEAKVWAELVRNNLSFQMYGGGQEELVEYG